MCRRAFAITFLVLIVYSLNVFSSNPHHRARRRDPRQSSQRRQQSDTGFSLAAIPSLLESFGIKVPKVEFDGQRLSLHNPPTSSDLDQDAERIDDFSDDFRGERGVDATGATQQRIVKTRAPKCVTRDGDAGRCVDLGDCPILLVNPDGLRKSICVQKLIPFSPGVCCPNNGVEIFDLGGGGGINNVPKPSSPQSGVVVGASNGIQPQGTTRRPPVATQTPRPLPSLAEVTTQSPNPQSPFIQDNPQNVPGTSIGCGETKVSLGRIVGGRETVEGQSPWMVAIYLLGNGKREFWCGGALVSPIHVVTAAHCTLDSKKRPFQPGQYRAVIGEWDLKDNDGYSVELKVRRVDAHPEFRPNGFYSDVAVFTLERPVQLSQYIQPICLPTGNLTSRDLTGTYVSALGWGSTHYGGDEVSKLNQVSLPVWTQRDCDDAYFQPITEVFLCAGYSEGGKDACQGDSGGPLILYDENSYRYVLVGVVSFGNRCAEPGYPGVYTKLTHFLPWILEKMLV